MLDYIKTILVKVSFDRMLFEKELRKALSLIVQEEFTEFKNWCYSQFAGVYPGVLNRVFVTA